MQYSSISEISKLENQEVLLKGWAFNFRSSGSIFFLQLRDGSSVTQCVFDKSKVSEETWENAAKLTVESSVEVSGVVSKHPKKDEYELQGKELKLVHIAQDYPISNKEHGTEFLMDNRHLWLRSSKQAAALRIRSAIIQILQDFYTKEGFYLTHTPSITTNACEGGSDLFEIDYFGEKAYLSQNGQLYLEALVMSLGKVYDLNPNFRAEKSKTRRHLIEFWTLNPEIAFCDLEKSLDYQEKTYMYLCKRILEEHDADLKILERDTTFLQNTVEGKFPRLRHKEAVELLHKKGLSIGSRDDFGAEDETVLTKEFDRPIFVTHYPKEIKPFYMPYATDDPSVVLNNDMLAPEGYGEIVGGSQRIHDYDLLLKRMNEENLDLAHYQWYLDLRKYGSVPHSGYGIGIERTVAWICGLKHVRETTPFPRMLNRLTP